MYQVTDDVRIKGLHPLISPALLMDQLPITERVSKTVAKTREDVSAAFCGQDDRLVVVVGPCSIHDPKAAIEYANKLLVARQRLQKDLIIVMRIYFEKPRTTVGWKGLINDPNLDNSFRINHGLTTARELLLELGNMGVPVGSEFLDTIIPQYISDLVSWGAIGARTTESQVHRELASGLSMPIGFKNGTTGSIQIAVDAIRASYQPHHFLSVTKNGMAAIVATTGNDACHIILRGSSAGPNYEAEHVKKVKETLQQANVTTRVMIDCSHGNSNKQHDRQVIVAKDIAEQLSAGETQVAGVMLESNLVEGNQKLISKEDLTYGQSITDACISWEQTIPVLETLSAAVQQRRKFIENAQQKGQAA